MNIVIIESIGISLNESKIYFKTLKDKGFNITYYLDGLKDDENIIKRIGIADIIVVSNMPLKEKVLSHCRNLKMISVAFTGVDHIDLAFCKKNNIVVCNSAGYSTRAVAELALGATISLYRKINEMDNFTRNLKTRDGFLGSEIFGKTVGIIGTGAIGTYTAQLFNALGADVIAYSRTIKANTNYKNVDFENLLKESDIISLHVPLTEDTKELINKEALNKINSHAIIINTARGNIIDLPALAEALRNNTIAGAAIDVYEKEPPLEKDHPLFNIPNTILLPHIGYATKEAIHDRTRIVVNNIVQWISGNPINQK